MSIFSLVLKIIGQASASVIREAEGPTSIFIAGKIGGSPAVIGIFAGIILVVAGAAIIYGKDSFTGSGVRETSLYPIWERTCKHDAHKLGQAGNGE